MDTQKRLINALMDEALDRPDSPVLGTALGGCLAAVRGSRTGLAAMPHGSAPLSENAHAPMPETLHGLVRNLATPASPLAASLGVAALNALLAPPAQARDRKGQDIILEQGRGRRVAVVGHFPFVERLAGEFEAFDVLELRPRPGDLPAQSADTVLPKAQVAAITGSSLVNGTLGGLLDLLSPDCFVVLMGPSAPFARCLFDFGVDVLAGSEVTDPQAAMDDVAQGRAFRQLSGVRSVVWSR